jgi:hypothetical protein
MLLIPVVGLHLYIKFCALFHVVLVPVLPFRFLPCLPQEQSLSQELQAQAATYQGLLHEAYALAGVAARAVAGSGGSASARPARAPGSDVTEGVMALRQVGDNFKQLVQACTGLRREVVSSDGKVMALLKKQRVCFIAVLQILLPIMCGSVKSVGAFLLVLLQERVNLELTESSQKAQFCVSLSRTFACSEILQYERYFNQPVPVCMRCSTGTLHCIAVPKFLAVAASFLYCEIVTAGFPAPTARSQ